jgi:preprotein translocase subunit YajC
MEPNLIILIPGFIAMIALIIFFVLRNQKDRKEFMQQLIKEDEGSITSEHDTEVNPAD